MTRRCVSTSFPKQLGHRFNKAKHFVVGDERSQTTIYLRSRSRREEEDTKVEEKSEEKKKARGNERAGEAVAKKEKNVGDARRLGGGGGGGGGGGVGVGVVVVIELS